MLHQVSVGRRRRLRPPAPPVALGSFSLLLPASPGQSRAAAARPCGDGVQDVLPRLRRQASVVHLRALPGAAGRAGAAPAAAAERAPVCEAGGARRDHQTQHEAHLASEKRCPKGRDVIEPVPDEHRILRRSISEQRDTAGRVGAPRRARGLMGLRWRALLSEGVLGILSVGIQSVREV